MWLPPLWEAYVESNPRRPSTRLVGEILDDLMRKGLVQRTPRLHGDEYYLTLKAFPYYSDGYFHGLNPLRASYLCYSDIVPERVLWTRNVTGPTSGSTVSYQAAFQWKEGPSAAWAQGDPLIQSHSVVLSPAATPLVLTFSEHNKSWKMGDIEGSPFGTLVDTNAWRELNQRVALRPRRARSLFPLKCGLIGHR